jgi:hypothetical protein
VTQTIHISTRAILQKKFEVGMTVDPVDCPRRNFLRNLRYSVDFPMNNVDWVWRMHGSQETAVARGMDEKA